MYGVLAMAKKENQPKKSAAVVLPNIDQKKANAHGENPKIAVIQAKPKSKKHADQGFISNRPAKKQKSAKSMGLGLVAAYSDGDTGSDNE